MAGRLISRTGRASRFPTAAAFANYAGAAPVEIASADKSRHRLSRHGDRQLNSALHTIAITQIRMPSSRGHRYYKTKIAEGKTPREAARCLKRRLADHLWRIMINDERRGGGPGRTPGDDSAIQRGWPNPNGQLFGQVTSRTRHPRLYDGRTSRLTNTEAPKGTDLSRWSAEDLEAVAVAINGRPRKILGWKTPAEALRRTVSVPTSRCCVDRLSPV